MKNKYKIPIIVTELFLLFMVIMGIYNSYLMNQKYGWTWNVTTIINDVEYISESSITEQIVFIGFLAWINILIFILLNYIYRIEIDENELAS